MRGAGPGQGVPGRASHGQLQLPAAPAECGTDSGSCVHVPGNFFSCLLGLTASGMTFLTGGRYPCLLEKGGDG